MTASPSKPNSTNTRSLGPVSLTTLVIASMIGAGVFTTSGFAIADLQSPTLVLAAWGAAGVIAICGAISYGQLARRLTENGGEYLYLSRYLHPSIGFIAGWISMLVGFTSAGAYAALAFESYASPLIAAGTLPSGSLASALVVLATLTHGLHTGRGAIGQTVLVAIKLSLLGLFLIWAFSGGSSWAGFDVVTTSIETESNSQIQSIRLFATSVMWISLSYCGFNAAIYVAGESKSGGSNVATAMVTATACVTVLYLLLNAVFVFGPSMDQIAGQQDVAAIAAMAIGGEAMDTFVRVCVSLGLASSVSSTLMAGPRVYAKMARDSVFPKWFDAIQSPPTRAAVLQGAAILVVVWISNLQWLLSYLSLTLMLCSAATVATLWMRSDDDWRMSAGSQIAVAFYVVASVVIAALFAWNSPAQTLATLGTLAVGGFVWALFVRTNVNLEQTKRM